MYDRGFADWIGLGGNVCVLLRLLTQLEANRQSVNIVYSIRMYQTTTNEMH